MAQRPQPTFLRAGTSQLPKFTWMRSLKFSQHGQMVVRQHVLQTAIPLIFMYGLRLESNWLFWNSYYRHPSLKFETLYPANSRQTAVDAWSRYFFFSARKWMELVLDRNQMWALSLFGVKSFFKNLFWSRVSLLTLGNWLIIRWGLLSLRFDRKPLSYSDRYLDFGRYFRSRTRQIRPSQANTLLKRAGLGKFTNYHDPGIVASGWF